MTTVFILLLLLALLFIGVPVAFALGGLGLLLLWLKDISVVMVPQALYSSADNFMLLAVPLFLLMSNILLKGGVGKDLFNAVQSWVGHFPGGLGIATIVSCALFSAISGSSVATAATIATVAIPEMIARGYNRPFVLGLLAAGGTLGILIPPSIPLILYGVITEESIVKLFMAGVGPGLMLTGFFIVYSIVYALFDKSYQPSPKASWSQRRQASLRALPTLFLAIVVIGGIYLGIFTPTESAGVGFALSLIIVLLLRTMTWDLLKKAVMESMATTVTIFLIIAGAKLFGKAITLYRIPQEISAAIITNIGEPALFIVAVCLVLLVIGFFLESISMLLIMMPVLAPALGPMMIDPIWFGILFVVMIECALITPPVGMNLFIIQAVAQVQLAEVLKGVWPFMLIMLVSVILIYLFPDIVLYLPFKL
ncbi:TRAP transporter large permease [Desulfofustis limnaeus]|jgi:tripartite ATP-independent transporter DctM subunit|uniref:C4-dicarboxylate ABC transporter permease n=1 Tax=Desulfofustis limnaeus TaxID=2740163 RepID=A0ABN6M3K9_9BACT|nr:TRAP transporter large permease [Desulfofustis limnaeus]MDX9893980.1 TRAP transporter large permease [Desulfofustis sp.]BDD87498.1 C4-dicarboxylate ABC transporter permease [Desulfofustis limnaeus]